MICFFGIRADERLGIDGIVWAVAAGAKVVNSGKIYAERSLSVK